MLKRMIDLLSGREAPDLPSSVDDLELAVAALLVEAARMDSDFDAAERATIRRLLAAKFDLAPEAADRLVETAERAVQHSTQLFPFAREICKRMSPDARVHVIEMLWKVAYSDGALDPHEDMLVRRVAGLIHVPDRERALARQRALEKLAARNDAQGRSGG
jgi:uncharacterized tellurite resistance protein B-like protein